MGKKEKSELEIRIIKLAESVKDLLLNEKIDEVAIPCRCIPMTQKIKEYVDYAAVGTKRANSPYTYKLQLVTDKIQLGLLPEKDRETYNLVIKLKLKKQ